ncbi:MAG: phosphoribosylaminoimidazolesuccinocarboxamide synthase [Balneolaceae bacterium]
MRSPDALQECINRTNHPELTPYRGKVRDVYPLPNQQLAIVVTDRISAFDHIMKQAIPYKGQILNQLSGFSFQKVADLLPTHLIDIPHPNVTIAKKCDPLPIEVVVRGYLTGHAWRVYRDGGRTLCGVDLPEGMAEHQAFPEPILTPATKAEEGHDEDISEAEILERGIVTPEIWEEVRTHAFRLFARGQEVATHHGLILVDTKYEFGLWNGDVTLIDEVHTADSSRYFYLNGYEERQSRGAPQKQLSKEFLREMLMDTGFQGLEGETLPDLSDRFRWDIHDRYAELFEKLTGSPFEPVPTPEFDQTLEKVLRPWLIG